MDQALTHHEHLQLEFFFALRRGDVLALRNAVKQGASPHMPYPGEHMTAWEYAARHTPSASLRTVFSFLEEQNVVRHPPALLESHPCLILALHLNRPQAGELAWEIWHHMRLAERRRVLLELDAWLNSRSPYDQDSYRLRLKSIWRHRSSLKKLTPEFKNYRPVIDAILTAPSSLKMSHKDAALLTEESLLWCLSGLHLNINRPSPLPLTHDFGRVFLAAPVVLVKRCLEEGEPRKLVMQILERALHHVTQEGSPDWSTQHPTFEQRCVELTRQWHAHGVHWPYDWPEPVREALYKIPAVRRFWEGYALTQALPEKTPPPSTLRARL